MRPCDTVTTEVFAVCAYIPVVSTLSACVEIFLKCVAHLFVSETTVQKDRFWTYIKDKETFHSILILLPIIGNIIIILIDHDKYKEDLAQWQAMRTMAMQGTAAIMGRSLGLPPEIARFPANDDEQRLLVACVYNNVDRVKELLKKGVSPNCQIFGMSIFMAACSSRSVPLVKELLQYGGDATLRDATPYHNTIWHYVTDVEVAKLLQAQFPEGSDLTVSNTIDATPLMQAASRGNSALISYICGEISKNGSSEQEKATILYPHLNVQDKFKNTALHYTTCFKDVENSKLLLQYGADPFIPDSMGRTAYGLAKENNLQELVTAIETMHSDKISSPGALGQPTPSSSGFASLATTMMNGGLIEILNINPLDPALVELTKKESKKSSPLEPLLQLLETRNAQPRTGMEIIRGRIIDPELII